MKFFLICLVASALLAGCNAGAAKPDLSSYLQNGKAAVFIFLAPDCPLSQNYTRTLNELNSDFERHSIRFYSLVAGDSFQQNSIEGFVKEYKVTFPLLRDRTFELADFLGAM